MQTITFHKLWKFAISFFMGVGVEGEIEIEKKRVQKLYLKFLYNLIKCDIKLFMK